METVFNRFQHLEEMRRMGLRQRLSVVQLVLLGGQALQGGHRSLSTDLRSDAH